MWGIVAERPRGLCRWMARGKPGEARGQLEGLRWPPPGLEGVPPSFPGVIPGWNAWKRVPGIFMWIRGAGLDGATAQPRPPRSGPEARQGPQVERVVVLRLPAASGQQPALLWRAPMWRRTTPCSGTPSRPPPRVQHSAQPDWPQVERVVVLRLPAASGQQPALLWRARMWRRTTPCSGTPSRPPPRVQHSAQPGWPLASGRWKPTLPQRSDTSHLDTIRLDGHWPQVERVVVLRLPAASGQQPAVLWRAGMWRRTTPCSGTPSRPPPRVQHPAQPGWPLASGRWKPTLPQRSDTSHLDTIRLDGHWPQVERVVVLRLPAASGQQPALLWRARVWRRTTPCSGTPSRPPPRVQHPAQPGWPLAAGRW